MNQDDIIRTMKRCANAHEIYRKTSFMGCRTSRKDGSSQSITIDIFDAGQHGDPNLRYYCVATLENGKAATGNNAATIEDAVSIVHWEELEI